MAGSKNKKNVASETPMMRRMRASKARINPLRRLGGRGPNTGEAGVADGSAGGATGGVGESTPAGVVAEREGVSGVPCGHAYVGVGVPDPLPRGVIGVACLLFADTAACG